jgi:hypothetical protein
MNGALIQRRSRRWRPAGLHEREHLRPADHVARLRAAASKGRGAGALTLDDLVASVWQALNGWETTQCPLCGGAMGPSGRQTGGCLEAEGEDLHGECVDCGTRLS